VTQVELSFPTLDSALRYAERHGLSYTVHGRNGSAQDEQPAERSYSASEKLGLQDLQGARNGGSTIRRSMSLDAKRSILINWTWIEHLIDQAPDESISKDSRPSRLKEVEEALLDLQRRAA
jgi:hypothetical protein